MFNSVSSFPFYLKTIVMESNLPRKPFNTLALSLSGGGYRAASFHLGLLTYLSEISWEDTTLLNRVRVISTVSGGTFTGVCYATALASGESLDQCYHKIYNFMRDVDLAEEGLKNLSDPDSWNSEKKRSLINAFSLVYFKQLENNTFAHLFDHDTHLKEIIFNATEFSYGLPFRFQRVQKTNQAFFGNYQVNMPYEALREVRLADVIAASSCFPMGFEPINFPNDFRHSQSPVLNNLTESQQSDMWGKKCKFPVGLMDGGIVDNQGIDSVLNAEKRMRNYTGELKNSVSDDAKSIDLYVISDVSSPFMDSYVRTEEKKLNFFRKLSFNKFKLIGSLSLLLSIAAALLAFYSGHKWLVFGSGILSGLFLLGGVVSFLLSFMFGILLKKFDVPEFFRKKVKHFTGLRFGIYETLISNRLSSVVSMVSEVFMKQIRRQEYGRAYDDPAWKTRLITNTIYELTPEHTTYRNHHRKDPLSPELRKTSPALMAAAAKAKSMGTTLWFTPDELKGDKENMLDTLIACGQFTTCFNLIEYIEKILRHPDQAEAYQAYPDELREKLDTLYKKLMSDWETFNKDPYFMVKPRTVK